MRRILLLTPEIVSIDGIKRILNNLSEWSKSNDKLIAPNGFLLFLSVFEVFLILFSNVLENFWMNGNESEDEIHAES